jgi:hypothetical protein
MVMLGGTGCAKERNYYLGHILAIQTWHPYFAAIRLSLHVVFDLTMAPSSRVFLSNTDADPSPFTVISRLSCDASKREPFALIGPALTVGNFLRSSVGSNDLARGSFLVRGPALTIEIAFLEAFLYLVFAPGIDLGASKAFWDLEFVQCT